jgi:hypothetical protein
MEGGQSHILKNGPRKSSDLMDYALFWMAQTEMKLGARFEPAMASPFEEYQSLNGLIPSTILGTLDVETGKLDSAESSVEKVSLLSNRKNSSAWLRSG